MKISFAKFEPPRTGAVVVGVWEEGDLTAPARQLDELTGGAIKRALAASPKFNGKRNQLIPIVAPANLSVSRIVLAGLGKPDAVDARGMEDLAGTLLAHLNGAGETEATFAIDTGDAAELASAAVAAHLGLGAALRAYRFDKYRTTEKAERKPSLTSLTVAGPAAAEAQRRYETLSATAEAVAFTRDLVSEPANVIYPETLAEQAAGLSSVGLDV
ncbi:MAG TPA: M17 family peptidase N-terminal domain-containing protein, partial [Stellaceae bacterium]|nr:M17 family peptidase N-terminal domain-containing protein [Stellaceae bacterium]